MLGSGVGERSTPHYMEGRLLVQGLFTQNPPLTFRIECPYTQDLGVCRKKYGGAIGHTGYYQEWGGGLKAADVYLIDLEARRT